MDNVNYDDIVRSVLSYYDSGTDFWNRVNLGQATPAEIYDAYSRLPQMQINRSYDGTTLGWDWSQSLNKMTYKEPDDLTDEINRLFSNSQKADYGNGNSYKVNIPGYWSGNGTDGYHTEPGAKITGTTDIIPVIADKVSLAVSGINLGAKLGMSFDSGLYNTNPQYWAEHYPTVNPATWSSIATTEFGKEFIRILFGTRGAETQAYMQTQALAQTFQVLKQSGAYASDNGEATVEEFPSSMPSNIKSFIRQNQPFIFSTSVKYTGTYNTGNVINEVGNGLEIISSSGEVFTSICFTNSSKIAYQIAAFSKAPFSCRFNTWNSGGVYTGSLKKSQSTTLAGKTIYYVSLDNPSVSMITGITPDVNNVTMYYDRIGYAILFGNREFSPGVPGIRPTPSVPEYPVTTPTPQTITAQTTDGIISQLKEQYPNLFDGSITTATLQDDGTIKEEEWVPVPFPTNQTLNDDEATTGDATQTKTQIDEQTYTDIVTSNPTTNPPDTGEGEGSPYVVPTGNASSLWAVYHPSQAQLNAFGAWLWSSDFVEQLKRLFNDPMQAIIGVHKVFAPIPTGGSQNIKCGYLDSGVSSPTVSSQYTEVDCGTVDCREYFGNVFDYDPHTKVSIYLPFIGVVPLKVSEVMRASITVTYGVDVITGACLAKVKVNRDGGGAILYSYGGSCACHYPISSGSYAGIISGIVTSAIGIAGGIVTGNPLSAIGGAMAGLHQAHTDVQRSGGFTGCAGAMGPKKPYLIIDRPQTRLAADFEAYQGKPANSTQLIGDCAGFVRATEVHFSAPGVFDEEAREVESLLKAGVKLD